MLGPDRLEHDRISAAWVSLDATENDPKRFWSHLLAAVRKVAPDVGEQAQRRLQAAGSEIVRDVLPRLVNDLAGRPQDLVVVLDDLHAVSSEEVYESLALLLTRGPPTLHLVVTGRTDPPLPVSRLRVHGDLVELRAERLRFTGEESGRLFHSATIAVVGQVPMSVLEHAVPSFPTVSEVCCGCSRRTGPRLPPCNAPIPEGTHIP